MKRIRLITMTDTRKYITDLAIAAGVNSHSRNALRTGSSPISANSIIYGHYTEETARKMADAIVILVGIDRIRFINSARVLPYRRASKPHYMSSVLVRALLRGVTASMPTRIEPLAVKSYACMHLFMNTLRRADGELDNFPRFASDSTSFHSIPAPLRDELIPLLVRHAKLDTASKLIKYFEISEPAHSMLAALKVCAATNPRWQEIHSRVMRAYVAEPHVKRPLMDQLVVVGTDKEPGAMETREFLRGQISRGELPCMTDRIFSMYVEHALLCPALVELVREWTEMNDADARYAVFLTLARRLMSEPLYPDEDDTLVPSVQREHVASLSHHVDSDYSMVGVVVELVRNCEGSDVAKRMMPHIVGTALYAVITDGAVVPKCKYRDITNVICNMPSDTCLFLFHAHHAQILMNTGSAASDVSALVMNMLLCHDVPVAFIVRFCTKYCKMTDDHIIRAVRWVFARKSTQVTYRSAELLFATVTPENITANNKGAMIALYGFASKDPIIPNRLREFTRRALAAYTPSLIELADRHIESGTYRDLGRVGSNGDNIRDASAAARMYRERDWASTGEDDG